MQNERHFDYIIIGNGLAGLQLALALSKDSYFDAIQIALIDPSEKNINDKTWSFWEQGHGLWDDIVEKSWNEALFYSPKLALSLSLEPYKYKTIRALDFYSEAKQRLSSKNNIHFIIDAVQQIEDSTLITVIGATHTYTANHIFDSRIPEEFYKPNNYSFVQQHFKGLLIESDVACFQPEAFTMMDYRFSYKGSTSFIYVLPFSETKALIEFTFFTPSLVETSVYDEAIESYIKNHLGLKNYHLLETEVGNIPMTDFPFWNFNTEKITKIGTGGGWVKGSTGYSFKHTEKKVAKLISNIKAKQRPSHHLFKWKFKFYDTIFLAVLKNDNHKGIWIFEQFYSKNSISTMFRFLDEETSFAEDLKIMYSLFSLTFIKAFFRVLFRRQ